MYQPESSAMANELPMSASVAAPSVPEVLDNFIVFSSRIWVWDLRGWHVDDRVDHGDRRSQGQCAAVQCHDRDIAGGRECGARLGNEGSTQGATPSCMDRRAV